MDLSGAVRESAAEGARDSAALAGELGLHALWCGELAHDPFIPLAFAAAARAGPRIGTSVAIAFSRTPTAIAQAAFDLQRLSGGGFRLGLGTQVRAHFSRRFGGRWEPTPTPRRAISQPGRPGRR